MKLNVCCGNNKISGYINIDAETKNNPDQVVDLLSDFQSRFQNESIEEILLFHAIEHFEEIHHKNILIMFYNALVPEGWLYISYPEFSKIATNYITNHKGLRDFWKKTIYGLQRYPGDYHVSLMDTPEFINLLQECGFKNIEYQNELKEDYNTIIRCQKGQVPASYEDLIKEI